jgi:hypothetical protein
MRIRPLPLLLLLLTALPVFADDVYLVNGRKFEGVMTETTDSQIRIQMQGGVIVLPRSQVLRVEAGDSNLAEFLRRREALKKSPGTRAADWIELARWAQSRQLDQATRESALAAAALDPRAPGLASLLRGYGYVLDEQMDRWVPYADVMRRKGFVQVGSQWISREEYQEKLRDQREEETRRRADRDERTRAAREERIAALTELALTRELTRPSYPSVPGPYTPWGEPVILLPGFVMTPPVVIPPMPPMMMPGEPRKGRDPASGSMEPIHIPGSLIPGRLPGQH